MTTHTRTESLVYITNVLNEQAKSYLGIVADPTLVKSIRDKFILYVCEKLNYIGVDVKLKLTLTKSKIIKNIEVICEGKPMYDPMLKSLLNQSNENKTKIKAILDKDLIHYDFNRASKMRNDTRLVNDNPYRNYGDSFTTITSSQDAKSNKCGSFPYIKSSREITKYPKINKILNYLATKSKKVNELVEYYDPRQVALRNAIKSIQSQGEDWMKILKRMEYNQ